MLEYFSRGNEELSWNKDSNYCEAACGVEKSSVTLPV